MISSKCRGLTYAIFRDKKNIGIDDLGFPVTGEITRIVSVIIGSKRAGLLQNILGVSLFTVGAIATGGVIQLLSPQPTGLASKQSADNKASYAFGSVTNTAAQGYPVPLLYGKRRIGGAIISAGIYVEDQQ